MSGNAIPLELYPIQETGYHCFLTLFYHDLPLPMVLDTGASRTVLDTAALERMDLSQSLYETEDEAVGFANNGVSAQLVNFPSLQIGSFSLEHWPLGAINLSHINKTYKTLSIPPVSGILGNDLLVTLQAKIDIGRKQIRVWEPSAKQKQEIPDTTD